MEETTGTAHFSIDGEWLTDFCRTRVLEGCEDSAVRILNDTGGSLGVVYDILSGRKRFVGTNEFDLLDETPERFEAWRADMLSVFGRRQRINAKWWAPKGVLRITPGYREAIFKSIKVTPPGIDQQRRAAIKRGSWIFEPWCNEGRAFLRLESDGAGPGELGASGVVGKALVIFEGCDAPPAFIAADPELWSERPLSPDVVRRLPLYEYVTENTCARRGVEWHEGLEPWWEGKEESFDGPSALELSLEERRLERERDRIKPSERDEMIESSRRANSGGPDAWPKWEGEADPCPDREAVVGSMMALAAANPASAVANFLRLPSEEQISFAREQIRAQADASGWLAFSLPGGRLLDVPRGAFECYALQRCELPEERAKATPWRALSGKGWKQGADDPLHTDWILGARLRACEGAEAFEDLDLSSWSELEGLSDAAMEEAWKIQAVARGEEPEEPEEPEPSIMEGFVLSGLGSAFGRAFVAKRNEPVPPGSIAILRDGGPDFVKALQSANACVLARGGRLCHLAIVGLEWGARLIRIPDAIERIPEGAELRVDFFAGRIEIMSGGGR